MRQARYLELGAVTGAARDLVRAVDAAERLADDRVRAHGATCISARATVRRRSDTLKPLWLWTCAPSVARAAAPSMASAVSGWPTSASSTCRKRPGIVATPPAPMRASETNSPSRSADTAQEASAHSKLARSLTFR